jgi:hypothetical protein
MFEELRSEMNDVFQQLEKTAFVPNPAMMPTQQEQGPPPGISAGMPSGEMQAGGPPPPMPGAGVIPPSQDQIMAALSQITGNQAPSAGNQITLSLDDLIKLVTAVTGKGPKTDKATEQRLAQVESIMGLPQAQPEGANTSPTNPTAAMLQQGGQPPKQASVTTYGEPAPHEHKRRTKKSKLENLVSSLQARIGYDGMKPRIDR